MAESEQHSRRMGVWRDMRLYGLRLDDLDPRNNRPGDKPEKLEFQMLMRLRGVTFEAMQDLATIYNFDPIDLKDDVETRLSLFPDDEPDKLKLLEAAANDGFFTYGGLPFHQWPENVISEILNAKQPIPKSRLASKNSRSAAAGDEDKQQIDED